jgi:hypothetical protein
MSAQYDLTAALTSPCSCASASVFLRYLMLHFL